MYIRIFRLVSISRMPTVIASSGIRSILPRDVVMELISRVSRDRRTIRVGKALKASNEMVSPGSGGSLKATWPVIPIPPNQTSHPP